MLPAAGAEAEWMSARQVQRDVRLGREAGAGAGPLLQLQG